MTKSWLKSKTNGFGGALAVLGIAIAALPELQDTIDKLPVDYQGYAVLVVGIIVMILRHITTGPVSTNAKSMEIEFAVSNVLDNAGYIEAVLVSNGIPYREIKSPEDIENDNMRYLYNVWSAMEQAKKLKGG